jgi:hypothetical protein
VGFEVGAGRGGEKISSDDKIESWVVPAGGGDVDSLDEVLDSDIMIEEKTEKTERVDRSGRSEWLVGTPNMASQYPAAQPN